MMKTKCDRSHEPEAPLVRSGDFPRLGSVPCGTGASAEGQDGRAREAGLKFAATERRERKRRKDGQALCAPCELSRPSQSLATCRRSSAFGFWPSFIICHSSSVILLLLLSTGAATAQMVTARWVGGSGNWSDPAHWDIGTVPSNAGGTTYHAIIDVADQAPLVTINQAITLIGLTLAETLQVTNGGSLTVSGNVTNTGIMAASGGQRPW